LTPAASYLYGGVWDELCQSLRFNPRADLGEAIQIFADVRGLVLSTGCDGGTAASVGSIPDVMKKSWSESRDEANAVVKAYRPLFFAPREHIDYRDFIACGVFNWRALFITALGADREPESATVAPGAAAPMRYLLLTRGELNRREIGRMVERINALGSLRLYWTSSFSLMQTDRGDLRRAGEELDELIDVFGRVDWGVGEEGRAGWPSRANVHANDVEVERRLASVASVLDEFERDAIDGLPYRISKSRFYASEMANLIASLHIGNLHPWMAYDEFISKGIRPGFDYIARIESRLAALRGRLNAVTEAVQISAMVNQTEASRRNAKQLEDLVGRTGFLTRLMGMIGQGYGRRVRGAGGGNE
jgi:hypothetical protein